jgi:hypothetical protein
MARRGGNWMPDRTMWPLARLAAKIIGRTRNFVSSGRVESAPTAPKAARGRANRRELLGSLRSLPVLGAAGLFARKFSKALPQEGQTVVLAGPTPHRIQIEDQTLAPGAELENYTRLRSLELDSPIVVAKQKQMPVGKIGNLTIGRLISGSNLINMNMHARDLGYVTELARRYSTEGRMFMTLKKLEEHGVNTFILKAVNFRQYNLRNYKREWGGKLQWIADVIVGRDIDRFEKALVEHLELGAGGAYLWGGSTDQWYAAKQEKNIIRAYETMRKYKIVTGICSHRVEPIMFCEKEGLKPDFYFTTFHHDHYWSAHSRENRGFLEVFQEKHPEHDKWHDNMFHHDPEKTADFMRNVKVPWIAFKVLAAGAIPPQDGFKFAFQNGADFICVGMFDWQVEEDVRIAIKSVDEAKDRKRPWVG